MSPPAKPAAVQFYVDADVLGLAKARRRGAGEAPRITLRRAVSTAAAGAASEQEFFARLEAGGLLVRRRFGTRNPAEITGYAVALPGDHTSEGTPVWFSGGKLAADPTLPKLRCRWQPARPRHEDQLTPEKRNAIWEHAARTAADATSHIRHDATTDPAAAADAAWAAADTLHAAASALNSRVLRQATASYDRAARAPYGRIPRPTPAGNSLRHAARLLSAMSFTGDRCLAQIALIARLAALIEDIADLRAAQHLAAQTAAARRAAEHLHAARTAHAARAPGNRARPRTPAEQARLDFPTPPGSSIHLRKPAQPGSHPRRSPRPHRPRGPTR